MTMSNLAKDLTDRQGEYLRGISDGLSFREAAAEAGYEMPVFKETRIKVYDVGSLGARGVEIGEMVWLLPQEVD